MQFTPFYLPNSAPNQALTEQKNLVADGVIRIKSKGESWYLIALPWYQLFCRYVGFDPNHYPGLKENYPGPIDNSSIVDDKGELLPGITEKHFMAVPEDCWNKLSSFYHLSGKAPIPLARTIILDAANNPEIELYPIKLIICQINNESCMNFAAETVSRTTSLEQLCEKTHGRPWLEALTANIKQKTIFFWLKRNGSKKIELQSYQSSMNLARLAIESGSLLIFQRSTSNFPPNLQKICDPIFQSLGVDVEIINSASPSNAPDEFMAIDTTESNAKSQALIPGLCGLDNLGSTCFLNTVIQCFSNVPEFREYFTSGAYKAAVDRNKKRGELADSFSALLRSMWSGLNRTAMPKDFREAFLKNAPYFGQGQQDASNFLESFLNSLKEDLSRSEPTPMDKRLLPVEKSARDHWLWYKEKHPSLIVDLFEGQFKSTLKCEKCGNCQVNFEPFCSLTLPIPAYRQIPVYFSNVDLRIPIVPAIKRSALINFRPADPKQSVILATVMVPVNSNVEKVRKAAAEEFAINADSILIAGMNMEFRFTKWYEDEELSRFGEREVAMLFEIEKPLEKGDVRVVVYVGSGKESLHGFPYLLCLPRSNSSEMRLNQLVYHLVEPLFCYDRDIPIEGLHYSLILANQDFVGEKRVLKGTGESAFRDDPPQLHTKCLIMLWDSRSFGYFFSATSFEAMRRASPSEVKDIVSLTDCFASFLVAERLAGLDAWRCPKCNNEPQPALKKMDLTLLPPYFVIHLSRFRQDDWGCHKMDTFVRFPLRGLDMSGFLVGPPKAASPYDLAAVINHSGELDCGHYKASVLHEESSKWFEFDDRYVKEQAPELVVTEAAFILLYRRRKSS